MAYKYEGLANLAALDEDEWGESRDAVRLSLHRIDRALRQVFVGSNPISSGNPTAQNIGGFGGSTVTINQVDESEFVKNSTEGILVFGRGETDSLAHAIRVNSSGEILIAELPGTRLAAAYSQNENFPDFLTHVGTIQYSKMEEHSITNSDKMARLNAASFMWDQFNWGAKSTDQEADSDVGLVVAPSPKVYSKNDAEDANADFNGRYYTPGTPPNGFATLPTFTRKLGNFESDTIIGAMRFRSGVAAFEGSYVGTPPGVITFKLFGRFTSSGHNFLLKSWTFDMTNITNLHVLRFDVEMPFLRFGAYVGAGSDNSNYYMVSKWGHAFQS